MKLHFMYTSHLHSIHIYLSLDAWFSADDSSSGKDLKYAGLFRSTSVGGDTSKSKFFSRFSSDVFELFRCGMFSRFFQRTLISSALPKCFLKRAEIKFQMKLKYNSRLTSIF